MIAVSAADPADLADVVQTLKADGLGAEPLDGRWLAARDGNSIIGVARTYERDGAWMLEDVWVTPERRRAGTGRALVEHAKRRHAELWLVCDEDMVGYYARLGFVAQPGLPAGLAKLNAGKGYWQPTDHVHVAMLATTA